MTDRDTLVEHLVDDLAPVTPPPPPGWRCSVWLLGTVAYVALVTAFWGPLRPDVGHELLHSPRFAFESLLGLLAIGTVTLAVSRSAIPGRLSRGLWRTACALVLLWIGLFAFGMGSPALETGMAGKRAHCFLETIIYAMPPLLVALYWLAQQYPLRPGASAAAAGVAAGLVPAWWMQFACMYDPAHILLLHVLPGLSVALPAAVLAATVAPLRR